VISITVQAQHADFIRDFMKSPPQTNEVQRSAMIVPALHYLVAAVTPDHVPSIELLEIGASAGLNQYPDRVQVDYGRLYPSDWNPDLAAQGKMVWTARGPGRIFSSIGAGIGL